MRENGRGKKMGKENSVGPMPIFPPTFSSQNGGFWYKFFIPTCCPYSFFTNTHASFLHSSPAFSVHSIQASHFSTSYLTERINSCTRIGTHFAILQRINSCIPVKMRSQAPLNPKSILPRLIYRHDEHGWHHNLQVLP